MLVKVQGVLPINSQVHCEVRPELHNYKRPRELNNDYTNNWKLEHYDGNDTEAIQIEGNYY